MFSGKFPDGSEKCRGIDGTRVRNEEGTTEEFEDACLAGGVERRQIIGNDSELYFGAKVGTLPATGEANVWARVAQECAEKALSMKPDMDMMSHVRAR